MKLSEILDENVDLVEEKVNLLTKEKLKRNYQSKILVLENIRFYKEEELNDPNFAKKISELGDYYVNEAFSCSHRSHASVSMITKYIKSFSGLLFEDELNALKKLTSNITRPLTCIIGGSKVSTKLGVIENLIIKLDNIIILGGMANNFLKYNNVNIGQSIYENNSQETVKKIIHLAKKNNCKIFLPNDVKIGKNYKDKSTNKELNEIQNDDIILDVGNKSLSIISSVLRSTKTVLWNGPAGYFESPYFAHGSSEIAKMISKLSSDGKVYSVIGGGDTVAVVNQNKLFDKFNFVSTAGGAFLEYLEGKELPGISALN